jgi:hypothetical protein
VATPKSQSLQRPSAESRMLEGLMSMCTMLRLCRYSSPCRTELAMTAVWSSVSFLITFWISDSEWPTYSIIIHNSLSSRHAP